MLSLVLPTYNEADNLPELIPAIEALLANRFGLGARPVDSWRLLRARALASPPDPGARDPARTGTNRGANLP